MKRIAVFTTLMLVSGCASVRPAREEVEAVGMFRLMEIGGTHEIELRRDHKIYKDAGWPAFVLLLLGVLVFFAALIGWKKTVEAALNGVDPFALFDAFF